MQELKDAASSVGIRITPKGYFEYDAYHRISDWPAFLRLAEHHDPIGSQLAGWLRSVRC
jgi:hypothetical protein